VTFETIRIFLVQSGFVRLAMTVVAGHGKAVLAAMTLDAVHLTVSGLTGRQSGDLVSVAGLTITGR